MTNTLFWSIHSMPGTVRGGSQNIPAYNPQKMLRVLYGYSHSSAEETEAKRDNMLKGEQG